MRHLNHIRYSCVCVWQRRCDSVVNLALQVLNPAMPVRRCLFERPDHDELKKELATALRDVEDGSVQKQKWNYDFLKGRPLAGRYEWTEVSENTYVPEFYRKGYSTRTKTFRGLRRGEFLPAVSRSTQLDKLSEANHGCTAYCTPCVPMSSDVRTQIEQDSELVHSEGHVCNTSDSNTTSCESSPVQSRITDFMQPRKRKRESIQHTNIKSPKM